MLNFECLPSSLHVNPSCSHLGASADGLISCDCCGFGLIEINCPYKYWDIHLQHVTDSKFLFKAGHCGNLHLIREHEYYYQVQALLAVCEKLFCDFICWTPVGMHVEHIIADPAHIEEVKTSLDNFFVSVLLPRLLTGSISSQAETTRTGESNNQVNSKFCHW